MTATNPQSLPRGSSNQDEQTEINNWEEPSIEEYIRQGGRTHGTFQRGGIETNIEYRDSFGNTIRKSERRVREEYIPTA